LGQLQRLRAAHAQFRQFMAVLEEGSAKWAVVGGAPRTWVLGEDSPRDIDIVASLDSSELDARIYSLRRWPESGRIGVHRNSFGGYKLTMTNLEVDLWPARRTYGVTMGWANHRWTFRAVAVAAPLSCDSLVISSDGSVH